MHAAWNYLTTPSADGTPTPADAAWLLGRLAGPLHRLVWDRAADWPLPEGCQPRRQREDGAQIREYRRLYVLPFARLVEAAAQGEGEPARLAHLANWWLTATGLGDDPLGTAYVLEDAVPAWLVAPLRAVLDADPDRGGRLQGFRRAADFRQAVEGLRAVHGRHTKINHTPGPEILADARDDAAALLRAADNGAPEPPAGLRLLAADPADWASEKRGTKKLDARSSVWNSLVGHLCEHHAAALRVERLWTTAPPPAAGLPADWAERLATDLPEHAGLARALVADLGGPADEPPAFLDPAAQLAELGSARASTPSSSCRCSAWSTRPTRPTRPPRCPVGPRTRNSISTGCAGSWASDGTSSEPAASAIWRNPCRWPRRPSSASTPPTPRFGCAWPTRSPNPMPLTWKASGSSPRRPTTGPTSSGPAGRPSCPS